MSMYYFETEPMMQQPLGENEYLVLVKVLNGKTKEEKEKYKKQQECLKLLRSGYVNAHNRNVSVDSIFDRIFDILNNFNEYYVFRIKHIANKREYGRDYVSEFNVEKEFVSADELIRDIDGKYMISDLYNKLISRCSSHSEGYSMFSGLIKNVTENQSTKVGIFDILRRNLNKSNLETADNIILSMLKNETVLMKDTYENINVILQRLLENKLFKSALYFVQAFVDEIHEISSPNAALLRGNSDSTDVMSILDILKFKIPGMVLDVIKVSEEGIELVAESRSFRNLDDVKTYIIRNFNVSYSELQRNISEIEANNPDGSYGYIKFKINE